MPATRTAASAAPLVQQTQHGLRRKEWRIPIKNQHLGDAALRRKATIECMERSAYCVASSERRLLHNGFRRPHDARNIAHLRPQHDGRGCGH